MISSVDSGSVLFTPRIGSRYEYGLLWMALIVIFFMWVMIREVGWYSVVTTVPTPVAVFLTLYLNRVQFPEAVRPGWFSAIVMVLSGLFFTGFAILYCFDLFGIDF
jgi:Mn2+/Fe2+ NRAMP family transporter